MPGSRQVQNCTDVPFLIWEGALEYIYMQNTVTSKQFYLIIFILFGSSQEKYPDVCDTNINSLIGGFFLLRFLNPAIVTPNGMIQYQSCY